MATEIEFKEAERLYPYKKFSLWYQNVFPIREYIAAGCLVIVSGIVLTASNKSALIPTVIICVMLVFAAVIHIIAWYQKRSVEKKRAEYLGMSLYEYTQHYC